MALVGSLGVRLGDGNHKERGPPMYWVPLDLNFEPRELFGANLWYGQEEEPLWARDVALHGSSTNHLSGAVLWPWPLPGPPNIPDPSGPLKRSDPVPASNAPGAPPIPPPPPRASAPHAA